MQKDTNGKLRLDLIPPRAEEAMAKVREFGSKKYKEEWAWLDGVDPNDLITASQRHIREYRMGEMTDNESGLPHIWHALTSLAMAVELINIDGEKFKKELEAWQKIYETKESDWVDSQAADKELMDWIKADKELAKDFLEDEDFDKVEGYGFFKKC